MNITMLVILILIVVPGYFIVNQISKTIYSNHSKLEQETEKRYGFSRLERERMEKEEKERKNKERVKENKRARSRNKDEKKP
jgi:predicted Holliday junction resolvase-like endonuclease